MKEKDQKFYLDVEKMNNMYTNSRENGIAKESDFKRMKNLVKECNAQHQVPGDGLEINLKYKDFTIETKLVKDEIIKELRFECPLVKMGDKSLNSVLYKEELKSFKKRFESLENNINNEKASYESFVQNVDSVIFNCFADACVENKDLISEVSLEYINDNQSIGESIIRRYEAKQKSEINELSEDTTEKEHAKFLKESTNFISFIHNAVCEILQKYEEKKEFEKHSRLQIYEKGD